MPNFADAETEAGTTLLENLKAFLGITDGTQDAELTIAINLAGDFMETYLDRVILKREVGENFSYHFGTVILHNLPVDDDVTVLVGGVAQTGYSWYVGNAQQAYLSHNHCHNDNPIDWHRLSNVSVTYTAGFDPIPNDLAYAINIVASGIHTSNGTGQAPGGSSGDVKKEMIVGVGSLEYDVGGGSDGGGAGGEAWGVISSTAAQMVSKYKRMSA